MKCMYCGGEVPAKSTKCPYCGKENASGIAFMQEVRQKEERNKQLPEKILKKNASWLSQKILTRIILVSAVLNILLLSLSFFMFLWSEREPAVSSPSAGSHAERYLAEYGQWNDYYITRFTEYMDEYLAAKVSGEEVDEDDINSLVEAAYDLAMQIYDGRLTDGEAAYAAELTDTFFRGYMGLPEDMQIFYRTENWDGYDYEERKNAKTEAVEYLCEKEGIS